MATYAGNLKRFNGTDWDLLLPNPAPHTQDLGTITTSAPAGNIIISSGSVLTHTVGLSASKITADVLNTARLGTGTASSSTWLRGDGTWAALPGDNNNYLTSISNTTSGTNQLLTFSRNGLTDLTTTILGATDTRAGLVTTGAQTIAGDKSFTGLTSFNTSSGTTPLRITRTGSTAEAASMYLDDSKFYQSYFNDENASAIRFILNNTDTETGGGAQANSGYVEITQGTTGTGINVNGTAVSLDGHTHSTYLPLSGGTLTGKLRIDALGIDGDSLEGYTQYFTSSTSGPRIEGKYTAEDRYLKLTSSELINLAGPTLVSGDLTVSGNLTINGTTTTVNTQTLNVSDNIVVLNNDVTGTPSENAGIEVKRGTSANTSLLWNESLDRWTFTNNGSNYYNIPLPTEYSNNAGTVTEVTAGTQISGMSMTITNGTTTPSIATSISNAANFRAAIGAGTSSTNGTVTSVGLSMPTGFTVINSPVTTSGTLTVALTAGYDLLNNTTQTITGNKTFATSDGNFAIGPVSGTNRIQSYSTGVPIRFLNTSNGFADISVNDVYIGGSNTVTSLLSAKQDTITGAATTIASSNLTPERVVVSDTNGKVTTSSTTSSQISKLNGVPSAESIATREWVAEITSSPEPIYNKTVENEYGRLKISTIYAIGFNIHISNLSEHNYDRVYMGTSPNPTELAEASTNGIPSGLTVPKQSLLSPGIGPFVSGQGYLLDSGTVYNIYVRGYNIANNTYYDLPVLVIKTKYNGEKLMASVTSSNNIKELDTATYPNLTELSRLKGVTSSVQTQINTNASNITTKAPISHASTATTYGVGTSSNYGHLRISDIYDTTDTTPGIALSIPGAKSLFEYTSISTTSVSYGASGGTIDTSYNFLWQTPTRGKVRYMEVYLGAVTITSAAGTATITLPNAIMRGTVSVSILGSNSAGSGSDVAYVSMSSSSTSTFTITHDYVTTTNSKKVSFMVIGYTTP